MNSCSCIHMTNYKSKVGMRAAKIIHAYFVSCISDQARRNKARCTCHTCNAFGPGIHACLDCVYLGCYKLKHIHEHARTKNHELAIDISHGSLYCFGCKDVIYDAEYEKIAKKYKMQSAKSLGMKVPFVPWHPEDSEIELLRTNPKRVHMSDTSYIGLRGLVNMGKTCYVNCVIQALIHTPLLRDYFLAEQHVCEFQVNSPKPKCLVCEMSELFQEFYSGKKIPHVPYRLLPLVWTHAKHLVGAWQQDAHEFFMATLDILHDHCKGTNGHSNYNLDRCNCIIDQIFFGVWQSDVKCKTCMQISTTNESFRDISLDLVKSEDESTAITLNDCLGRFTRTEELGKSVNCDICQEQQYSTKRLTMKKLPVVASFHLKRFESYSKVERKIMTHVEFPEYIDLAPFTSSYKSDSCSNSHNEEYILFAVVNHLGDTMGTGHYTSYIRKHKDQWFKCNDDVITSASLEEVLGSQGYLLFYHRHTLKYE